MSQQFLYYYSVLMTLNLKNYNKENKNKKFDGFLHVDNRKLIVKLQSSSNCMT